MRALQSLAVAVLVTFGAVACAQAGSAKVKCLLEIRGTQYINGRCPVFMSTDGSFMLGSDGETSVLGYLAMVNITGENVGEAFWNEEPGANHAHGSLGYVHREGACWVNDSARICAWR